MAGGAHAIRWATRTLEVGALAPRVAVRRPAPGRPPGVRGRARRRSRRRAPPELPPLLLAGVGWATVELDRAEAELAEWLAGEAPDPAPDDVGADPRRAGAPGEAADGLPGAELVLLEPTTEGRLAASLARDGEGPCALYPRPAGGARRLVGRRRGPARSPRARSKTGRSGPRSSCLGRAGRGAAAADRRPAGGYHPRMNDVARITLRAADHRRRRTARDAPDRRGLPGRTERSRRPDRALLDPDAQVLVAEAGGRGDRVRRLPRRAAVRDRRAVRPDRRARRRPLVRERGVGHRLMADAERVAREAGASFVEVTPATTGPRRASCSSPWATTRASPRTCASGHEPGRHAPDAPPMTFPRLVLRDEVADLLDLPWELPLGSWGDTGHRFRRAARRPVAPPRPVPRRRRDRVRAQGGADDGRRARVRRPRATSRTCGCRRSGRRPRRASGPGRRDPRHRVPAPLAAVPAAADALPARDARATATACSTRWPAARRPPPRRRVLGRLLAREHAVPARRRPDPGVPRRRRDERGPSRRCPTASARTTSRSSSRTSASASPTSPPPGPRRRTSTTRSTPPSRSASGTRRSGASSTTSRTCPGRPARDPAPGCGGSTTSGSRSTSRSTRSGPHGAVRLRTSVTTRRFHANELERLTRHPRARGPGADPAQRPARAPRLARVLRAPLGRRGRGRGALAARGLPAHAGAHLGRRRPRPGPRPGVLRRARAQVAAVRAAEARRRPRRRDRGLPRRGCAGARAPGRRRRRTAPTGRRRRSTPSTSRPADERRVDD